VVLAHKRALHEYTAVWSQWIIEGQPQEPWPPELPRLPQTSKSLQPVLISWSLNFRLELFPF